MAFDVALLRSRHDGVLVGVAVARRTGGQTRRWKPSCGASPRVRVPFRPGRHGRCRQVGPSVGRGRAWRSPILGEARRLAGRGVAQPVSVHNRRCRAGRPSRHRDPRSAPWRANAPAHGLRATRNGCPQRRRGGEVRRHARALGEPRAPLPRGLQAAAEFRLPEPSLLGQHRRRGREWVGCIELPVGCCGRATRTTQHSRKPERWPTSRDFAALKKLSPRWTARCSAAGTALAGKPSLSAPWPTSFGCPWRWCATLNTAPSHLCFMPSERGQERR